MTQPIFNYEQISILLALFFQKYGYNPINPSPLITNLTFNYGLNYEDKYGEINVPNNTYLIQKCSRVDDIKKAINDKKIKTNIIFV